MDCTEKLTVVNEITGETLLIRVQPEIAAKANSDAAFKTRLARRVFQRQNDQSSNTQQLVQLTLRENSDVFTLHVSPADHNRALTDVWFATQLLQNYKETINKQALNALSTNKSMDNSSMDETKSMQLPIFDDEDSHLYTIQVSPAEHKQATQDKVFARCLLATHKHNLKKGQTLKTDNGVPLTNHFTEDAHYDFDDSQNETRAESQGNKGKNTHRWTDEQTLLLLSLYQQHCSRVDNGSMTSRKFWTIIVEGLKEKGHVVSMLQCTSKMDSLKKSYKRVKDHNACSGNNRKSCDYYEILDELFSKKPWIKPLSTAGSNIPMTDMPQSDENSKNKRRNLSDKIDRSEYMRQSLENQRIRAEATASYRQRKLDLLADLTEQFKNSS